MKAKELYEKYCEAVGGVAFNGDPLPTWEEFAADPAKEKQANAWRAVADMVDSSPVMTVCSPPTPEQIESRLAEEREWTRRDLWRQTVVAVSSSSNVVSVDVAVNWADRATAEFTKRFLQP